MHTTTPKPAQLGATLLTTLTALALVFSCGCNGSSGLRIQPKESFVLAYVDQTNTVRVRNSDNGTTWTSIPVAQITPPTTGLGLSASPDTVGVTTVLTRGVGGNGRLRLRFGLGATTWDSTEVPFPSITAHGRPNIVDLGNSKYLISTLDANINAQAVIFRYDHTSGNFTDVTPTGLPSLDNSLLGQAPAMVYMPTTNRVLVAWRGSPAAASPKMQLTVGDVDNQKQVNWTNVTTWTRTEPTSVGILSEPALAQDQFSFYLAVRKRFSGTSTGPAAHTLYLYASRDGINWYSAGSISQVPTGSNWHVQLAVKSNCHMLAAFVRSGGNGYASDAYIKQGRGNPWTSVISQNVFGNDTPSTRPFSLIVRGAEPLPPLWAGCQ